MPKKQSTNPFLAGPIVTGAQFCGRREELKELHSCMFSSQSVVLFSPRRMGKTSLILEALHRPENKNLLLCYVDLYAAINKEAFIRIYMDALVTQIFTASQRALRTAANWLPSINPRVEMAADGSLGFGFQLSRQTPVSQAMTEVLSLIDKEARRQKRKAVVVFDEVQEIASYGDEEVERLLRTAVQQHSKVCYIFQGSHRHVMQELFSNPDRAFYHSGRHMELGPLPDADLAAFIKDRFKNASANNLDTDALSLILQKVRGQPYLCQLLCSLIWESLKARERITVAHVEAAYEKTLDRERAAFENLWDSLATKQRALLLEIARSNGELQLNSKSLSGITIADSSIRRAVEALNKRGILLKNQKGRVRIQDLLFRDWLKRLL